MPHYVDSGAKGFLAPAALALGTIVKLNASGQVVVAAAATDLLLGVVQEAAAAGRTANVRLRNANGTSNVLLAGTVAVNDAITSNAAGLGITTVTAGNQVIGYAVEAGVAGSIIEFTPATLKY